jgi:hypothetical protein
VRSSDCISTIATIAKNAKRAERPLASPAAAHHQGPILRSWQVLVWPSRPVLVAELRPNLLGPDRTLRHSVRPNAAKLRGLKHLQRDENPKISHPLQLVETAGIEPASAIAQKVASTSVAGALISLPTRHAGGVVESQLH